MNNKYKYTPDVFLVSAMDMNTAHIATIPNINATTCCPGPNAYVIAGWNNSRTDPEIIALDNAGNWTANPPAARGLYPPKKWFPYVATNGTIGKQIAVITANTFVIFSEPCNRLTNIAQIIGIITINGKKIVPSIINYPPLL